MEKLTKPAITRLARRGGVKSLSEDSHQKIRDNVEQHLDDLVRQIIIIHKQNKTKSFMSTEVYKALESLGYNVAQSDDINISTK